MGTTDGATVGLCEGMPGGLIVGIRLGLAVDGFAVDGFAVDGFAVDGVTDGVTDGATDGVTDGVAVDGVAVDGFAVGCTVGICPVVNILI